MAGPSVPEILLTLRDRRSISDDEYRLLNANYETFVERVAARRAEYTGHWVAVVGREIRAQLS